MEKGEAMGVEVAIDTTRKKVVNDDTYYADSILWLATISNNPESAIKPNSNQ